MFGFRGFIFKARIVTITLAIILAIIIGSFSLAHSKDDNTLTVYTAQSATTAQLPLLEAFKAGWPGDGRQIKLEYWKNLDDLRSLVLAGKGDIWVGHLEGLARAASRGAPVSLVAVTVWRKFYFVSKPLPLTAGAPDRFPESTSELLDFILANNEAIGSAPQNSPGGSLLKKLGGPNLVIEALPPQQLILDLVQGRRRVGLLPEPMATVAAERDPSIKIIGSLEEQYAQRLGGPSEIPQAGVAVNLNLAQNESELVGQLVKLIEEGAQKAASLSPQEAALLLPPETLKAIGENVVAMSLTREPIIARSAESSRDEIEAFLKIAAPDIYEPGNATLPESFFFKAPKSMTSK
ncbi:MAG: hypothetical protein LBE31_02110 [Deltaproteobacteria bacterium]|jgi:NitT/TauT family transport system substrate-binding protein|nr:hypothetical protein [Deltaproteobacteria bacterium]